MTASKPSLRILSGSCPKQCLVICQTKVRQIPEHVSGFTLIEVAIAVFIITLLLGGILVPLSTQVEQRKISETQKALEEMRESLMGFALANGHLPCPDKTGGGGPGTANDGAEDVNGTGCVVADGNIPWATLGTPSADSWGNRFRYRVHATFSQRGPPILSLTSTSGIEVCADNACAARLTTSGDGPAAVILSHGKNGLGAMSSITNASNPPAVGTDEQENADSDVRFVSRVQTGTGTGAGEFDDVVVWLSRNVLLNRLVAAGKLP